MTSRAAGAATSGYEKVREAAEAYNLFMETREWAIKSCEENPVHTAIMRVMLDLLLNKYTSISAFNQILTSLVHMSKTIEFIGGKVALAGRGAERKMEEMRRRMEPFTIFEDAYEGTVTAEGFAKMIAVSAKITEVIAGHFGNNIEQFFQMSEDGRRWLSSQFADTIVKTENIVLTELQSSLSSLGQHLVAAGKELGDNYSGDSDARNELLRAHGLSPAKLSAIQIATIDQYIRDLDSAYHEIANANRRTTRRKKTSVLGSVVRVVVDKTFGKDSGTVESARKMEREARERADELQGRINKYLETLRLR